MQMHAGSSEIGRRDFLKASAAGAAAIGAGGLLAACGGSGAATGSGGGGGGGEQVVFGFSHPFAEVPIVASIKKLVTAHGDELGWKVLLDETQAGKLEDQVNTLENWVTQKVTAICAAPTDPAALEPIARRAQEAGILWTSYGVRMEHSAGGLLFPPEKSGTLTGQATVDWIKANSPRAVVAVLGDPTNVAVKARTDIPLKMIHELTDATVIGGVNGPAIEQAKGLQVTEDLLQAHPEINVIVGGNDDGALGAADAFRKAGKNPDDCFIIGQDGSKDALVAIRKGGFLKATAALDIKFLSDSVVDQSKRLLAAGWKPGDPPRDVEIPPVIVTADDKAKLDQLIKNLS